jgi:hypothetical protein
VSTLHPTTFPTSIPTESPFQAAQRSVASATPCQAWQAGSQADDPSTAAPAEQSADVRDPWPNIAEAATTCENNPNQGTLATERRL